MCSDVFNRYDVDARALLRPPGRVREVASMRSMRGMRRTVHHGCIDSGFHVAIYQMEEKPVILWSEPWSNHSEACRSSHSPSFQIWGRTGLIWVGGFFSSCSPNRFTCEGFLLL